MLIKKGQNKCYPSWLSWRDKDADLVRVFPFYFSKAFDTVSLYIVCNKLKAMDVNPYITNWIMSFLTNRQQRVVVDGKSTEFVSVNGGVP